MKLLTRLKIGPRLGLAFAVMLALTALLGALSWFSLSQVNAATARMATNWLPAIEALSDYRNAVNRMRRYEAGLLMDSDPQQQAALRQDIQQAFDIGKKAWEFYLSTVVTEEERPIAEAIKAAAPVYLAYQARLLKAPTGTPEADEAARALYRGEGEAAAKALFTALEAAQKFQVKGSHGDYEQSQAQYANTRMTMLALLALSMALGTGLAYVITRSITGPVAQAVSVAETVAAGDLTSQIDDSARDEMGRLLGALKTMNGRLADIVGQVRNSSDSIATGSSEIATGNADLSQRTEEQASNLQQTAASMEQLTSTVRQNADTARQAAQLASGAAQAATQGGEVVQGVVTTMAEIAESSRRISEIIGVIDGIAFQTNILALNAAVEAARAGEQGRGFAVVAGEVRTLAQRSAQAAREIKSLITVSVEKVDTGTRLVGDAGTSMNGIVTQVRRVNDLISEISAASEEQTVGIGQVGDAVAQLDQVTQQNAALVEESAAAAESLRHQAAQLADVVSRFRLEGPSAASQQTARANAAVEAAPSQRAHRQTQGSARPSAATAGVPVRAPAKAASPEEAWATF